MVHFFDESPDFDESMRFGELIRKCRRLMGLNQTDFGAIFNVNQGTISMWELGITSPPVDKARNIADQLGFDFLIRGRDGEQQFFF